MPEPRCGQRYLINFPLQLEHKRLAGGCGAQPVQLVQKRGGLRSQNLLRTVQGPRLVTPSSQDDAGRQHSGIELIELRAVQLEAAVFERNASGRSKGQPGLLASLQNE